MNRQMLIGAMSAAVPATVLFAKGSYTLVPQANGMMLKDAEGKEAVGYLTSKPEGSQLQGNSVCCYHPLTTPSGECVTDFAPADHRDHRCLFFAWLSLDFRRPGGVVQGDFWGWGRYAPVEERVIQNRDIKLVKATAAYANLLVRNDWKIKGETMMTEDNSAHVTVKQGARVMDLRYQFGSDADVVINKVAFTGLCFVAAKTATITSRTRTVT